MNQDVSIHRCGWVNLANPLYIDYHDQEWGRPVFDDQHLFEMLTLEGAQAGLSWETVLNKRAHYRKVFDEFEPKRVADYQDSKVIELLNDPGIIRNRLKVASTINNANCFLRVQKEHGSFSNYLWQFVDGKPIVSRPNSFRDVPAKTELSDKISKDLSKKGFKFVGSTIIYAYMQAVGLVDDHEVNCLCVTGKLNND
ncbi:DNA-3-methyladenine glycosylase I [Leeia sp. TBRC 13508]|uniref:DNA-3-methyladenine glycosylase I n=1 Tax=Leeia speluncae TaxID=2884804 RepID=A0ABS8D854_9NEIS|nr:DNA-3-methyladenine glycosylase I [Leeia speluncae]MCB6184394.1 DNA-3-methyladenine glycosylase I [Leeia speluncae]